MRKVTFMTLVHNGERFVEETIRSVLNQSDPDFWYFVRLNACTDGSEEIVRRLAAEDDRIIVLKNKKNFWTDDGIFFRKRGFWPAFDSEYVAVLDHDDILHPDFIKDLYAKAKQYDADMAIGGNFFFDDETGKVFGERKPPEFAAEKIEDFVPYFAATANCLRTYWGRLMKAELYDRLYEKIRNVPKELTLSIDTWVMYDFLEHCRRVVGVNRSLLYYRCSRDSQFSSQRPKIERIGDGKVLLDKGLELLEKIGGKTEENVRQLNQMYLGHMLDLTIILRDSTAMTAEEKLQFMQKILQDPYLKSCKREAAQEIFLYIQKLAMRVASENPGNADLQRYYLFRFGQLGKTALADKLDVLSFFGAVFDKENPQYYGQEMAGESHLPWIAKRETAFFNLPMEQREEAVEKHTLRELILQAFPVTEEEKDTEAAMVTAMEKGEWVEAFGFLQQLDRYTLLNENGILCRLSISIMQENAEQAVQLACAGYSLFPENESIKAIYDQLFAGTE